MNDSYASLFQEIVSRQLSNTSDKIHFEEIHKRVQFKLWAARYFLNRLKQMERKYGALGYPKIKDKADLNLDAFLYEIIGAFDTLLQEINITFKCDLDMKDVKMDAVICRMPEGSKVLEKLRKLNGDSSGWFWKLREYRNHSAHRSVIWFYSLVSLRPKPRETTDDPRMRHLAVDKIIATYLVDNPRDVNSGKSKREIIPYCKVSTSRIENLIEEMYKKCTDDLK